MYLIMALPAQALKLVHMVHFVPDPTIIRVMHDEVMPASTQGAPPVGIVLHLLGDQLPTPGLQVVLVVHLPDRPGDLTLVDPTRFGHHPVQPVALADVAIDQILSNE